jgi:hypothetical protein
MSVGVSRWCAILLIAGPCTAPVRAGSPAEVRFDVPQYIACREVSPESSGERVGPRRLVEVRLPITALPGPGQTRLQLQYTYRVLHPTGTVEIVDYQPRTAQETTVAGSVAVEATRERQKTSGLSVSGTFQQLVQGTLHGDVGQKETTHVRYELKPPRDVTLVSGTLQRGSGVYFQLRPAAEASWEGSHEFAVVLRVPGEWRGDVLYVRCEAQEVQASKVVSRGVARFAVGLYAEGDEEARGVVGQFHDAEKALRRAVAEQQRAIEREAVPTVVHRVGAWLDVYQPRIPAGWLDRLVYGPPQLAAHDFVDHLPPEVRQAAERYVRAKRRAQELSMGRGRWACAEGQLVLEIR